MSNRLSDETSPYLRQHAENPVDWFPWGEEALARARDEDKPIFLSIGYSACHWCHVMEHESFEDADIAAKMNANFVNIKVDREERPDLDHIYMAAVQAMTGRGGWPMSVFLTPDLEPFYGGTYWPPQSRMNMPGFDQVLDAIGQLWQNRRDEAIEAAGKLTGHLQNLAHAGGGTAELSATTLTAAAAALERTFDHTWGGFGGAPKFPHSMDLQVLLRFWRRDGRAGGLAMVTHTLERMAAGGIYDQLGGGFHRYSVDARWLVPHFEKMLYDNSLLALCYLEAWQATGNDDFARVVRETLDYLLREMTDPSGGFYSTQDADSEGEEGKFYVWTPAELVELLGEDVAERFAQVYDVTDAGNFEGSNILHLARSIAACAELKGWDPVETEQEMAAARAKLLEVRGGRIWPGRDEKILLSWNALAIDAFAQAGAAFGEPRYVAAASAAADFVLANLRRDDGRLLHCWCEGQARFDAYLDDYANLTNALVSLWEATFDPERIRQAAELADTMLTHFEDERLGGFFFTADDHEKLIARNKDVQDGSVPSGNSMAAYALTRLGKLTANAKYLDTGGRTLSAYADLLEQSPAAFGQMLLALDLWLGPTMEIVVLGDVEAVLADLRRRFLPRKVVAARRLTPGGEDVASGEAAADPLADLFAGKPLPDEGAVAYICQQFRCEEPVAGKEAIGEAWNRLEAANQSGD